MDLDAVALARGQFAFTIAFHILWPAYTIGLASFVATLNALHVITGREIYRRQVRFWTKIFALGFGMGVVTGVVLSYQIGTNWSGFSARAGNVLGPLLTFEVLTAFFLEAGFIGIMLFGQDRVGPKLHLFASIMVAVGTVFSAFWILAANSWMQTPQGHGIENGQFYAQDWLAVIFNPSFPYRFLHMVTASYLTAAFVVAGVSGFYLWLGRHVEFARTSFSLALWAAAVLAPAQIAIGDFHGLNTREHQPMKLAAMEGRWETARGVGATIFAIPDPEAEVNRYEIEIPRIGSLILTHEWNGEVKGLKEVAPADRPMIQLVFFAFRIMVGIGFTLFGIAMLSLFLRWRGRLYDTRWFHGLCTLAMPLGFVAIISGWVVTETGRQPWVVYGQLRTIDVASPLTSAEVAGSFLLFFLVYNLLLLAFFYYGWRIVLAGPGSDEQDPARPKEVRPGRETAAARTPAE